MVKRVTSREVAELAGVSRTTVSFVLNDVRGMRISEDTRQRVLEAAEQLGYHPNASARRLVTGKTRILAYVERQSAERAFADAILPQVLRGVYDAAYKAGYEVLLAPIPVRNGSERCEYLLRGGHVDGIILSGPRTDDDGLRQLLTGDFPIVLQGQWSDVDVASVDVDNFSAARMAARHLIQLGHTRIAILLHAPLVFTAAAARLQGYKAALEETGLSFSTGLIGTADFSPSSGEAAMEALFARGEEFTAVFATSDTVAIGAMKAAKSRGLSIPQDLAFVGFDDIPMSVYHEPSLTTVRLPAYGIGWAAADLLTRMIEGFDPTPTKDFLDTDLIVRSSCGSPPPD
ncbi:MAG: LacI family DNA-binding transcriptional regulator [Anaerolineales bacterium]|nr:LacI family DNA-binding transcriptional regulator [Anaerolineales bacterium]